ncbi:arginine utilization protein RocB [Rhizobium sp. BK275]|uniref:hypothetical protein n=1 Tax=Rhizobium sp. BK275 TaxID=2587077 RepID=UPI001614CC26|nr:hypothetical protein [Rhizobium sp. BK275]MBB3393268.1 arginine utilization protein RocB [Rhizobium sp. BK275]
MFDGDLVCRAVHYPKFITPAGIFDEELLLKFDSQPDGTTYAMSVASKFLCRNSEGVHGYGAIAATSKNERFRERHNRDPEPLTEEVHYLGFYEFTAGAARAIPMTHYSVSCVWKPEAGQDVHFQIEMRQTVANGTKAQRRNDRRAAIGVLFANLYGPMRHICPQDEQHRDALEAIDLPTCAVA